MVTAVPTTLVENMHALTAGAVKTYLSILWLKQRTASHITQAEIAAHMNSSERSVIRYIQELETQGYLIRKRLGEGMKTDYVLVSNPSYGA